ncbi:MAG: hypothetical protein ACLQPV_05925 [Vulcanimicrobiaceae bacterium]
MSQHEVRVRITEGLSAHDFAIEDGKLVIKSKSFAALVKKQLEEAGGTTPTSIIHVAVEAKIIHK